LYTGVTYDLVRRVYQHRASSGQSSFTKRYAVTKLVYYEVWPTALEAIGREKQIKAGPRKRKVDLIRQMNPAWNDLLPTLVPIPAKRREH
jgi:putative endonuclease